MTLIVRGMSEEDLERAAVADVAAALLAKDEPAFRAALTAVDRQQLDDETAKFAALMGYRPPAMIEEWRTVEAALPTHDSDVCWTSADRSLELDYPSGLPAEEDRGEFLVGYVEGLFAGLFKVSEDASGDRALAGLLPGPHQPPVLARSHGRGQVVDSHALKTFLVSVAISDEDPEPGAAPGAVGEDELLRLDQVLAAHDARVALQAARAERLLARCSWMSRPLRNATLVGLAELLARAPTIEDWERERAGELEPVLFNYWTIAHLLLGNLADAADAARRARQGQGEATRWLGQLAEQVLAGDPSAKVGRLGLRELQVVREQLHREAPPALLRP